jgi:hypothetical protein
MTRRAFSSHTKEFNYECDVVLWDYTIPPLSQRISVVLGSLDDKHNYVISRYDPKKNGGLSIRERLLKLKMEILDQARPDEG